MHSVDYSPNPPCRLNSSPLTESKLPAIFYLAGCQMPKNAFTRKLSLLRGEFPGAPSHHWHNIQGFRRPESGHQ